MPADESPPVFLFVVNHHVGFSYGSKAVQKPLDARRTGGCGPKAYLVAYAEGRIRGATPQMGVYQRLLMRLRKGRGGYTRNKAQIHNIAGNRRAAGECSQGK